MQGSVVYDVYQELAFDPDVIHVVRPPRLLASSMNVNGDWVVRRTRNPVCKGTVSSIMG